MPIYAYHCPTCRTSQDVFKPLAELERVEVCPGCHLAMTRKLSAPMVLGDYPGYTCPITGDWIEGRKAHQENLKKHGCRVMEPGEKEEFQRRKAAEEASFDKAIEATTEEFVEKLPEGKKAELYNELSAGATFVADRATVTP